MPPITPETLKTHIQNMKEMKQVMEKVGLHSAAAKAEENLKAAEAYLKILETLTPEDL